MIQGCALKTPKVKVQCRAPFQISYLFWLFVGAGDYLLSFFYCCASSSIAGGAGACLSLGKGRLWYR